MRDYSFGNFLHELRERRGLSQYQLGMLVGVSDKAVSKWENGSAKPQIKTLCKLSEILGITVDELLACKYHSAQSGNEKGVFAMKNKLWKDAHQALRTHYGNQLPIEILNRYLSEFAEFQETDIIIYFNFLSKMKSMANDMGEHMYVKGGIGASFIAYVLGATEINPLEPHYFCPHCLKTEFDKSVICGLDLTKKFCPCGSELKRDGHNLPFETLRPLYKNMHFDISVSEQLYREVRNMFKKHFEGNDVVTLVRKEPPNIKTFIVINEKISNIANGDELPFEDYYDSLRNYPSFTLMINKELDSFRLLEQETNTLFKNIDFACESVLEAFKNINTRGIPEFSSEFTKKLLSTIPIKTFNDLIQISGLSHSTNVLLDDAKELIKKGKSTSQIIAYRDDVFNYLQNKLKNKGITNTGYAYKIMEDTRRGIYAKGGISDEMKQQFISFGIEDWFLNSIKNIKYLFPKAHGALFVKYSLILMWYKLNYKEIFDKYFS